MLHLHNISYNHPNKELLFSNINLSVNSQEKAALIGNNGSGKSTLLRIIANLLKPSSGSLIIDTNPYYIPQVFGQVNHLSIAQVLQIEDKLNAYKEILAGNANENNLLILDDDWAIEERCKKALSYWQLDGFSLTHNLGLLSGGEKMKVFLAGLSIHQPEIVLMDEPSNHLDLYSRKLLYNFIETSKSTMLIVSHDRRLLNLLSVTYELSEQGLKLYGGNLNFYLQQKEVEKNALLIDIRNNEKALKKAKVKAKETLERQLKSDKHGKGKKEKAGVARIMMNTLRNNAEQTTAKVKTVHDERIGAISQNLQELRTNMSGIDKMRFGFDDSFLHKGKILFKGNDINFSYTNEMMWSENLAFEILSGERIALKGKNGSGKTTLINIMLGLLEPTWGSLYRAKVNLLYVDQDYSLLNDELKVYEQAIAYNRNALMEHEIKIRLHRFLFFKNDWDKMCGSLSGGERMRLIICCLTIASSSVDMIVLDEPTNNLDLQNVEILTAALNEYNGTLLVVSHDTTFLQDINIEKSINIMSK